MLTKVLTCAVVGLDGAMVEVEVDDSFGVPLFAIVGLPDAAVQEAKERVRSAVRNSNCVFPLHRIVVRMASAGWKRTAAGFSGDCSPSFGFRGSCVDEFTASAQVSDAYERPIGKTGGPAYDLPIAVALLAATDQAPSDLEPAVYLGELSLDGTLRHTTGILPMVSYAAAAGHRRFFVPRVDAPEAALVEGVTVYPVATLADLIDHLRGERKIEPYVATGELVLPDPVFTADMADVRGQEHVKRALEVAAAGGHNVIMQGPPGAGKTLLARTLPSILPRLTPAEALDVTRVYSVAGMLPQDMPLVAQRPFRAPHHTISHAGLVGGGHFPRPGEISLAHRGVLFLDELPEFGQRVLEVLRQPLEDGVVTISRAQGTVSFPAKFVLLGAMNPCPCGFFRDHLRACTCSDGMVSRYQKRLSGPLLDRIDIHVEVPRVEYEKLASDRRAESSTAIRARVESARAIQRQRFAGARFTCNAEMGPGEVREHCRVGPAAQSLLRAATQQLQLSARGYHRVLKLARTISDLAGAPEIGPAHIAEAIQYRPRERAQPG